VGTVRREAPLPDAQRMLQRGLHCHHPVTRIECALEADRISGLLGSNAGYSNLSRGREAGRRKFEYGEARKMPWNKHGLIPGIANLPANGIRKYTMDPFPTPR
jgi:hypothetical protein